MYADIKRIVLLKSGVAVVSSLLIGLLAGAPAMAAPMIFSVNGPDAATIAPTVDNFRTALGDLNPFEPVNAVGGRRQINWDAAPDGVSDPNPFAGDFFNFTAAPRARGIEFSGANAMLPGIDPASGFLLSSTVASGVPIEFGFDEQFSTFSAERLFAPTGGTALAVNFFDPANVSDPATSRGFGAVFTDVEVGGISKLSFFDVDGNLLLEEFVPLSLNGGLSFVGAVFEDPVVAEVLIVAGNIPVDAFDPNTLPGAEGTDFDVVAMDDFIFGEPTPLAIDIPAPATALLFAPLALLALRRRG